MRCMGSVQQDETRLLRHHTWLVQVTKQAEALEGAGVNVEYMMVPNIIHSTILRWIQAPADEDANICDL